VVKHTLKEAPRYTDFSSILPFPPSCALTEHHAMNAYWGSGGIDLCILELGTRWRWVVSLTIWSFYPQGKRPWYPLDRRLGGPQGLLCPNIILSALSSSTLRECVLLL